MGAMDRCEGWEGERRSGRSGEATLTSEDNGMSAVTGA